MAIDIASLVSEIYQAVISAPASGDPRTSASVRTPMQAITDRTHWTWKRLQGLIGQFTPLSANAPIAAVADATADTITVTGHGLSNGDHVRLQGTGAAVAPTGLAFGTIYFVVGAAANTVQLAATSGGAAINFSSAGTNPFFLVKVSNPDIYLPTGTLVAAGWLSNIVERFSQPGLASAVWTWLGQHVFANDVTFTDLVTFSGANAVRARRVATYAQQGATQTISTASDVHKFVEPSANCVVTLSRTPEPPAGASLRCVCNVNLASFTITFKTEGAATLAVFPLAGQEYWVDFDYMNNEWSPTGWGGTTTTIGA